MKGTLLAIILFVLTAIFLVIGYVSPIPSAVYFAGGKNLLQTPSTPEAAAGNIAYLIKVHRWEDAYNRLANKAQFSEGAFVRDVTGRYLSLRSFATLNKFDVTPLHESANNAEVLLHLHWSTVVGTFNSTRDVHLIKDGNSWKVDWPLFQEPHVPPQVIPMTYLRWTVIQPDSGDDWGAQNVAPPQVRIVDMRPVSRASGVVILGEMINQDVVPAWVSVRATLMGKNNSVIASAGSFDMISHKLLPKQVTPFMIRFPHVDLSQVTSVQMKPLAVLVQASASPVVEIVNQQFHPGANANLTGQLMNQSGEIVNFTHVLSTFYDKNGQVVWVAGEYVSRALLPGTPIDFNIPVPEDLAKQINSERTIVSTYSTGSPL